jgi:hypothetical protein
MGGGGVVEAGLADAWQAYNTICQALNEGYWLGHCTVTGDWRPDDVTVDPDVVY